MRLLPPADAAGAATRRVSLYGTAQARAVARSLVAAKLREFAELHPSDATLAAAAEKLKQPAVNEGERRAAESISLANEASGEHACVVCLDRPRTHIILPCGHKCLCQDCAAMVKTEDDGDDGWTQVGPTGTCPVCRTAARHIQRVWE